MINDNQKTSLLIDTQLPGFIRENPDYDNFRLFVQAYYEWMEQTGQVTDRTKNILNYKDVDKTTDEFIDYYVNEFLPYFPKDSLLSKQEAIKVARQLYQQKGTPASYRFLFKILYNSDVDIFYTKDAVLKASAGTWYVAKSLKLSTSNLNFTRINNLRLFGETTKSIATVESSILAGTKTEVFISNIQRLFESGEFVRVVDNNNQDVYFYNDTLIYSYNDVNQYYIDDYVYYNNTFYIAQKDTKGNLPTNTTYWQEIALDAEVLRAKIVGQISQIRIDPNNRGLLYQPGDPVVVYDGLSSNTGAGASAVIGTTTAGSITKVEVLNGGFGYRSSPNTVINLTDAPGAMVIVPESGLDPNPLTIANVALLPIDTIGLKKDIKLSNTNYFFSNVVTSNANTTLANAFSFVSFSTYPISSVSVTNGGGGITKIPQASAQSNYLSETNAYIPLTTLGILSPIQILNGGKGYQVNDTIVFTGGSGFGAKANVLSVNATGAITGVGYVLESTKKYPLGGFGYKTEYLPALSVNSANVQATGASLYVPGILGTGAILSPSVDRAGSITTINVIDAGEDYIETPKVSLKVQDIVVYNVDIANLPIKGSTIYQGANINVATYTATVNSITQLTTEANTRLSLWNMRVFNYNSYPDTTKNLVIDNNNTYYLSNAAFDSTYNSNGIKIYGDGSAKANASFLNGLFISQGQYLNTQGQPSSFDVLQSSIYNNFTYQLTVQESIAKYREVLLNLLHPSGTKVIGRNAIKAANTTNFHMQDALLQGMPLYDYTGLGSTVTMVTDFTNKSNNIIKFNNIGTANLANIITIGNTIITITSTNGPNVRAKIVSFDTASNTAVMESNVWLTFANVAYITGNSGSNTINITYLTGAYDIVNNGNYSNTAYPLKDIVFAGDSILVDNNTSKIVNSVDYINGKIYLTTNLSSSANSLISVKRNFVANSTLNSNQVKVFGPIGQQYINPELTDQNGNIITTQDGTILLVG